MRKPFRQRVVRFGLFGLVVVAAGATAAGETGVRARDLGIAPGVYAPGPLNAITDVAGVKVGHVTLVEGESVRTGATAILPHGGNLFQDRVPAGLDVANGFGKLAGSTQLIELGEIETPIVLTNTLSVATGIEAILDWTLVQPGNEEVKSINAIVGETNDSRLNDIRGRALTAKDIYRAIENASGGPVAEGAVGAGTGTVAFGWKGGIGTSSRILPAEQGGYTVGVLVQTNFGGRLTINGVDYGMGTLVEQPGADSVGSIMMIVATDAPLSDRNLRRLARRASAGLARTGAGFSNGSGDYAIAFSVAESVRRTARRRENVATYEDLSNDRMSPLFEAVAEATQEAIYNSLFMATTTSSTNRISGKRVTVEKFPYPGRH
ncbi:MAG: P1 family peptidase [Woeseiaceae bacterium]